VAVAVATGLHTAAQLSEHAPDLLFDDFNDVERAAAELLSARRARPPA